MTRIDRLADAERGIVAQHDSEQEGLTVGMFALGHGKRGWDIVERIKERDGKGAEQAMEQHLRSACERAMRVALPLRLG